MKKVTFNVVPTGLKAYWIAVGNKDVRLVNNKGTILLEEGRNHILIWWMEGNAGGSLSVTGELAGTKIVEATPKIPVGRTEWADTKVFKMPEATP